MIREEIKKLIEKAIKNLQKEGIFPIFEIPEIVVDCPKEKSHGDYSVNVAMIITKKIKKNPMEIAGLIKSKMNKFLASESKKEIPKIFEKIEIIQPGFINFFISKEYLQKEVGQILKQKEKFGSLKTKTSEKINVEFISANPTGPLTLGNGRGGFCGDVLANVLEKAWYKVEKEYYINDRGEQVIKLGHSVLGDKETVYKGKYINDLKKKLLGGRTSQYSTEKIGERAAQIILKEMIKPTVKKMGINFDVWFSEKSLHKSKEVEKVLSELKKKNLTYEKDGALWFKSTIFGDDKDRVLIKDDSEKTYFASDIAYLKNKLKRGFQRLIFFLGADHYGYVARLKAAAEALGYKKEQVNAIVMQLVRLLEKGKEVKMSKRSGIYVTIDELIDEVGLDVARFFFLTRSAGSHLNFDLELAKKKSAENPVYYVQYAHARICAILRKYGKSKALNPKPQIKNLKLLNHPTELTLIKQLIRLPEIVVDTAKDYQVQRLPQYAVELADAFHQFYETCQVLCSEEGLRSCRLSLVLATKIVLKNTLDLMGISAPEKM